MSSIANTCSRPSIRWRAIHPALLMTFLASAVAAQQHVYTFDGDAPIHFFGHSVAGAGDVNKDGYPDVVVGAPYDDKSGTISGSVRVLSGRDGKVLHTFYGRSAFDFFGYSVAGAGDVNKDGYADVVVGAPRYERTSPRGYVRVYSGRDGKALYTFASVTDWDAFGLSVAGAGDVNKDGYADILVGAPLSPHPTFPPSYARIFSGRDGTALYTFKADGIGDGFGFSVAAAGDVNKDGYPDFIVGAPQQTGTRFPGHARVFSGKDGKSLHRFKGDSAWDRFGWSVAGAGDVNMDGYADLIVGAHFDDNKGMNSGSARVFSGKDGVVLYTFDGDAAFDQFGTSVAGAGDVDQDGYADLLVGMPVASYGGARVLSGKTGAVLQTFRGDAALDRFGWSVASVGDINKDGRVDFVVGAPYDDNNGGASGSARVLSSVKLALTTDVHAFSHTKANTQSLSIHAGANHGGRLYQVFGSVTGTAPGVTLGGVTIPLVPDPWTDITIAAANSALLVNTRGTLSAAGTANARIKSGPYAASLVGLVLYHACVVFDAQGKFYLASNPVPLLLAK